MDEDSFFSVLITLLAVLGIWYVASHPNWGVSEHTVYKKYCSENIEKSSNCDSGSFIVATTHKPDITSQTIVYKTSNNDIGKLSQCLIYDAENWQCQEDGSPIKVSMKDGEHIMEVAGATSDLFGLQVPRYRYLIFKLKEFL